VSVPAAGTLRPARRPSRQSRLTAHSSLGLGLAVNRLKAQLATGDLGLTLALWMYRRLPGPARAPTPVPVLHRLSGASLFPPLPTSAAIGYAEASDPEGASMTFTRITVRSERLGGVRCVRGLRIPVATVVDMVATVALGHTLSPFRCRHEGALDRAAPTMGAPVSETVDTLMLDLLEWIGPNPRPTRRCSRRGGRPVRVSRCGKRPTTEASSAVIMRRDAARWCRCRPPGRSTCASTANRRRADGRPR
jgi:Family of unknown function (DUF6529)